MAKNLSNTEVVSISIGEKIVLLKIVQFGSEVDVEDLLKIDYGNVVGEILTFPVLLNRISLLNADMAELVRLEEFDLEIYRAQLEENYRKKNTAVSTGVRGGQKVEKPTGDEIKNNVLQDAGYVNRVKKVIRLKKEAQYIDSLFWSAKSKDKKLEWLSSKLKTEDLEREIIEGTINGIDIKIKKKLIK